MIGKATAQQTLLVLNLFEFENLILRCLVLRCRSVSRYLYLESKQPIKLQQEHKIKKNPNHLNLERAKKYLSGILINSDLSN